MVVGLVKGWGRIASYVRPQNCVIPLQRANSGRAKRHEQTQTRYSSGARAARQRGLCVPRRWSVGSVC